MEEGERTLTRAAASSIARGRPSNRAQISVTAGAFLRVGLKNCLTTTGRVHDNPTAGFFDVTSAGGKMNAREAGSASGGTGNSCSPYTCSAARLVTMILRLAPMVRSSATVGAA